MKVIQDLANVINFTLEINHPILMALKRHNINEAQIEKTHLLLELRLQKISRCGDSSRE